VRRFAAFMVIALGYSDWRSAIAKKTLEEYVKETE